MARPRGPRHTNSDGSWRLRTWAGHTEHAPVDHSLSVEEMRRLSAQADEARRAREEWEERKVVGACCLRCGSIRREGGYFKKTLLKAECCGGELGDVIEGDVAYRLRMERGW